MFERAMARAERAAALRARRHRERIAARLREELPGARVEADEAGVRVSGRGLADALRWAILGAIR